MRILAATDIHGAYARFRQIVETEPSADVIIIGGDLTTFGSPGEADEAISGLLAFGKQLLVVAGNMDPPELDEVFKAHGVSINARGRVISGVGFFGVSGAPYSPLNTPNEISEEEILDRAESGWRDVRKAESVVFVPHAPPLDTSLDRLRSGKHVGSKSVREFIDRHHPDVVVCGHIHEARGKEQLGTTWVVNCGAAAEGYYAVLDLGKSVSVDLKQIDRR